MNRLHRHVQKANGGSRISRSSYRPSNGDFINGLLLYRNDRTQSRNLIYIGTLHITQEITGIRRKSFNITALGFGINRIECQRRLTTTAQSRNHGKSIPGYFYIDVFKIVHPGTPYFYFSSLSVILYVQRLFIFRAQDIDVSFQFIFLSVGTTGLYDIIIYARRYQLSVITTVPTAGRILIMINLFAPTVEYPTFELHNRFISDFPFIVYSGTSIGRKTLGASSFDSPTDISKPYLSHNNRYRHASEHKSYPHS